MPVHQGIFGLAGSGEFTGCVEDARERGRGNAGAAEDKPSARSTLEQIGIQHPDTRVGIRVEGEIRRGALRRAGPRNARLVCWL